MTLNHLEIQLAGEAFHLLPQKAIYRPAQQQLLLTDVHLGKASHFRKKGVPMPAQSYLRDVDKMHFLLRQLKPRSVLILGDLFHSDYNREWLWIKSLLLDYPDTSFVLVEGNHDILRHEVYQLPNLIKQPVIEEDNFIFTHYPLENPAKINFCGHLHPGYQLQGKARQSETLPCFYFHNNVFLLPAFGDLTGLSMVTRQAGACLYLVTGTRVLAVNP